MKEITGDLIAGGSKIALVVSRFNSFLTEQLVKGACDGCNAAAGFQRPGGNHPFP